MLYPLFFTTALPEEATVQELLTSECHILNQSLFLTWSDPVPRKVSIARATWRFILATLTNHQWAQLHDWIPFATLLSTLEDNSICVFQKIYNENRSSTINNYKKNDIDRNRGSNETGKPALLISSACAHAQHLAKLTFIVVSLDTADISDSLLANWLKKWEVIIIIMDLLTKFPTTKFTKLITTRPNCFTFKTF